MLGRRRGCGRGYVTIARGLHRLRLPDDADDCARLRADALAFQLVLPVEACFGHLTSAQLRGWWLPPLPAGLPLFVAQPKSCSAAARPGMVVTRHPTPPEYEVIAGVRVMTASETLLACARHLSLLDLVVLVDCVLRHGHATRAEVEAVAARRRRGAPLLRQALALADGRSDSPYETLLRLLHVSCGIEVVPQYELLDEAGNFVAKGDLLLAGTTTFHEYDGADHLKRPQQRKDRKRDRRIGNSGAVRRGYTKEDVLTQGITILRDADLSLGRVHDPSRIRPWHDLLRGSLFTPAGTAVLCRRLEIPGPDDQIRGGGPSA